MFCNLMSFMKPDQQTTFAGERTLLKCALHALASWNFAAFHLRNENVPFNFASLCHSIAVTVRAPHNARLLLLKCCYLFCLKSQAAYVTWDEQQVSVCRFVDLLEWNRLQVFPCKAIRCSCFSSVFHFSCWSFGHRRLCLGLAYVSSNSNDSLDNDVSLHCKWSHHSHRTNASKANKNTAQHMLTTENVSIYPDIYFLDALLPGIFAIFCSRFLFWFPVSFDFVFTERIISDFNYIFSELIPWEIPFASVVNAVNFLNFSFYLTFCSFICLKRIANNKVPLCTECAATTNVPLFVKIQKVSCSVCTLNGLCIEHDGATQLEPSLNRTNAR